MSEALNLPLEDERKRAQLDTVPDPSPEQLEDPLDIDDEYDAYIDEVGDTDGFASEDDVAALRKARKEARLMSTTDPVRAYLNAIGKVPLLTAIEEVDLAKRIEAGLYAAKKLQLLGAVGVDRDAVMKQLGVLVDGKFSEVSRPDIAQDIAARTPQSPSNDLLPQAVRDLQWVARDGERAKNHLIEANLRLVVSLAKRYAGRGMPFIDLIQEGNSGLIRAVEKFDYMKGYKFSTYATWWIRQAVSRALADQARTIRIPVHMVEQVNKLGRIERELFQDLGRDPTPTELAKEMDFTEEKIQEIRDFQRMDPISLDFPLGDGGGIGPGQSEDYLGDFIADPKGETAEDFTAKSLLKKDLGRVLETLSAREVGVITLRYGLDGGKPRTLDEIGQIYGVTRERIRQIERQTMGKLKHSPDAQSLQDYLR